MGASYILINSSSNSANVTEIINKTKGNNYALHKPVQNNPDIFLLDVEENKKSIGITETKKGTSFLNEKPYQEDSKFLIIFNADRLTIEAQNSLLKILEEPPVHANIILIVSNQGKLLPTVVSRCRKMELKVKDNIKVNTDLDNDYSKFLTFSIGEKLSFIEDIAKEDKEDIIEFLKQISQQIRLEAATLKTPDAMQKTSKRLSEIRQRIIDLESTNINTRLALEELVINL